MNAAHTSDFTLPVTGSARLTEATHTVDFTPSVNTGFVHIYALLMTFSPLHSSHYYKFVYTE